MCVRRCPTLPHSLGCSTIGAVGLSFRVRDGTGRFPHAMTAVTLLTTPPPPPLRSVAAVCEGCGKPCDGRGVHDSICNYSNNILQSSQPHQDPQSTLACSCQGWCVGCWWWGLWSEDRLVDANTHKVCLVNPGGFIRCVSDRLISTSHLHPLLGFQFWPINPMVYREPSHHKGDGDLILKPASRLDAFSGYPSRT